MRQELQLLIDQLEAMKPRMPLYNLQAPAILFHEEIRLSILWIQGLQEWYNKVEDEHWRLVRKTKQQEAIEAARAQRLVLLEDEALWPEAYILNRPAELGVRRGRRVPEELKQVVQVQEGHVGPKTYVFSTEPYDIDATPLYAQQFPKLRAFEQPVKNLLETGMTGGDWQDYVPLPEDPNRAVYKPGDDGYEEELDHPAYDDTNYTELRGKKAQPANELIFDPSNTEEDESKLRSTWERVDFHDPAEACPRCHRNPVVCLCTPPTELDEVPDRRIERLEALQYQIQALKQKAVVAESKIHAFESYRSKDHRFEDHRLRKIQHLTRIMVESEEEASGLQWQADQVILELVEEGTMAPSDVIVEGVVSTFNPSGKYIAQTMRTRERDDAPYAATDFAF